jgi:L-arabinose isomerase
VEESGDQLRIGLLSVYFGLFDDAMPAEFRKGRERFSEKLRSLLSLHGEVTYPGLVDSEAAGEIAAKAFAKADIDAVVFAPTMASPPSYGWIGLQSVPDAFVIALGAQESALVPDDYDTEQATRRSLPVGLVMLTNVLVREGRQFTTLVGDIGSGDLQAQIGAILRGLAGAKAVRANPLISIGEPVPGYLDVEASPVALESLGVSVVQVEIEELNESFSGIGIEELRVGCEKAVEGCDATALDPEVLERSVQLALAIEQLCNRHNALGGAVNCHGPALRFNPAIGITACLAVTEMAKVNRHFACTGDLPAGIALILGKAVAGAALYCELYQLDLTSDWLLVANGGEGDRSIADPGRPIKLTPENHYMGNHGPGVAVAFNIVQGPATLTSLSPVPSAKGGWALIIAEGSIIDSKHDAMEGPNGMFRFDSGSVETSYQSWCLAGATHHAALLPGLRGRELEAATTALGIELRRV